MTEPSAQPGLFGPVVVVHCFFCRCPAAVVDHDPHQAHALMEAHYRQVHAAEIASLARSLIPPSTPAP